MDDASHDFALPERSSAWRLFADTAKPPPDDIAEPGKEPPLDAPRYTAEPRSVVILLSGGA
jgi:hypothetical protein